MKRALCPWKSKLGGRMEALLAAVLVSFLTTFFLTPKVILPHP